MNFEELAGNVGLEQEEYLELIELFIETGFSDLAQLQSAIEEGDGEKAGNAAHSVKGAAGNLGLIELSEIAKDIEEKARNGLFEGTEKSTQILKEKIEMMAEIVGQ